MQIKQLELSIMLLLGFGLTGLNAQSMYVKESNGIQTIYTLSNIRKMSFSSGNLTVVKKDNNSSVYTLNGISYLKFSNNLSGLDEQLFYQEKKLIAYPNPATNVLNIDLSEDLHQEGILKIINFEGKTVISSQIYNVGIVHLDISHLPNGIYLCSYINSIKTKTVKIIKY